MKTSKMNTVNSVSDITNNIYSLETSPYMVRSFTEDSYGTELSSALFDILFADGDVVRYSPDVYDTEQEAVEALFKVIGYSERPTWWLTLGDKWK